MITNKPFRFRAGMQRIPVIAFKDRFLHSYALDVNFGQQCHFVQLVKEDCACFELLFGNELQSLIKLL